MATPKKIGIWGTAKSGKTTYLAMLYQAFEQSTIEDVPHGKWYIQASTDNPAYQFIKSKRREIYSDNVFPSSTETISYYTYHITKASTNQSLQFEFSDAPGELYEHFYDGELKHIEKDIAHPKQDNDKLTPHKWFEELSQMDGIIIMLDPAWEFTQNKQQHYTDLVLDFLSHLREARNRNKASTSTVINDMYVALMYVKADAHQRYWKLINGEPDTDNAVTNWLQRQCTRQYDDNHANSCQQVCPIYQDMGTAFMKSVSGIIEPNYLRCFVVSSIGGRDETGTNTAREQIWRTPDTPFFANNYPQPDEVAPQYTTLVEQLSNLPQQLDLSQLNTDGLEVDYFPTTIRDKDRIQPTNVIDPIAWFIDILAE